jgi:hypothetical protein
MKFELSLSKMPAWQEEEKIHYLLKSDEDFIKLNKLIGRQITIEFLNIKHCSNCENQFADLFRMGFCKNCFFTSPQAGESIIRPELSKAHLGVEDRDLEFEKGYQLQEHIVYLANGGDLKVGVTRAEQMQNRWIDQGASQAIVFARTENRFQAGEIEVALKEFIGDKTPWRKMLKNEIPTLDLGAEKVSLGEKLPAALAHFFAAEENNVYDFNYPVEEWPTKLSTLNLDKQAKVEAVLKGIRGQYLLFEGGLVFNVRAHTGFRVSFAFA